MRNWISISIQSDAAYRSNSKDDKAAAVYSLSTQWSPPSAGAKNTGHVPPKGPCWRHRVCHLGAIVVAWAARWRLGVGRIFTSEIRSGGGPYYDYTGLAPEAEDGYWCWKYIGLRQGGQILKVTIWIELCRWNGPSQAGTGCVVEKAKWNPVQGAGAWHPAGVPLYRRGVTPKYREGGTYTLYSCFDLWQIS